MSHLTNFHLPLNALHTDRDFFLQGRIWPHGTDQARGCLRQPSQAWRGSHICPQAENWLKPTALPTPPSVASPCPSYFQNLSKGKRFSLTEGRSCFFRETIIDSLAAYQALPDTTKRKKSLPLPLRSSQPEREWDIPHSVLIHLCLHQAFSEHLLCARHNLKYMEGTHK